MTPTQKKKIEKGYYDPATDAVENDGEMHGTQTTQQPEQPAIATVPTQQTEQPEVQQPKSAVDGGFQGTGYGDLASWLDEQINATTPESEAERKAREKREKLRTFIGSIADMGSAIGSLAGTTNYAPPTFDPKSGVAPKYQEMYERNKAEFKENLGRNLTYRKMRQQIDEDEQNYKLALEKNRIMREEKEAKIELQKEKNNAYIQAQAAKERKDASQTAYWETKAELLERGYSLDVAESEAKVARDRAAAAKNMAQAGKAKAEAEQVGRDKTETTKIERDVMGKETGREKTTTYDNSDSRKKKSYSKSSNNKKKGYTR